MKTGQCVKHRTQHVCAVKERNGRTHGGKKNEKDNYMLAVGFDKVFSLTLHTLINWLGDINNIRALLKHVDGIACLNVLRLLGGKLLVYFRLSSI